jgi:hypothetical protein
MLRLQWDDKVFRMDVTCVSGTTMSIRRDHSAEATSPYPAVAV